MSRRPGSIRIVGGKWRSRKLQVPDIAGLIPTPDRVRETLFNWLQPFIAGAHCLDLYAGTGALGLEAASRGAADVILIEHDRVLFEQILRNIGMLDAGTSVRAEQAEALKWLRYNKNKYDLVFLDPPFGQKLVARSAQMLREQKCLLPRALIYMESEPGVPLPEGFKVVKEGKAGKVKFMLVELL
jgi:16S rRNA (guanine966-N2)-methyltransferase